MFRFSSAAEIAGRSSTCHRFHRALLGIKKQVLVRNVSTTIRIQGLPKGTTENDAFELSRVFGKVKEIAIIPHSELGRITPFPNEVYNNTAIVNYFQSHAAIAAFTDLHSRPLPHDWPGHRHDNTVDNLKDDSTDVKADMQNEAENQEENEDLSTQQEISPQTDHPTLLHVDFETERQKLKTPGWILKERLLSRSRIRVLHTKIFLEQKLVIMKYKLYSHKKKDKPSDDELSPSFVENQEEAIRSLQLRITSTEEKLKNASPTPKEFEEVREASVTAANIKKRNDKSHMLSQMQTHFRM